MRQNCRQSHTKQKCVTLCGTPTIMARHILQYHSLLENLPYISVGTGDYTDGVTTIAVGWYTASHHLSLSLVWDCSTTKYHSTWDVPLYAAQKDTCSQVNNEECSIAGFESSVTVKYLWCIDTHRDIYPAAHFCNILLCSEIYVLPYSTVNMCDILLRSKIYICPLVLHCHTFSLWQVTSYVNFFQW